MYKYFKGLVLFMVIVLAATNTLADEFKVGKPFIQLGHSAPITAIAIFPNGKYTISGSDDNTLKLWDVKTGKEIRTFKGHSSSVLSVAITKDSKYAISGSYDKTVKIWDIKTGKNIKTFRMHSGPVDFVSITKDKKYVLSGSYDKTLKLWDINTGKVIRIFKGKHGGSTITPDGKYILSASYDNTMKLLNIKTGEEIKTFESHSSFINSVKVTPNGKYIVSEDESGMVKVLDIKTGEVLIEFEGEAPIFGNLMAIDPDGKYIVFVSRYDVLTLVAIKTGKEIQTFKESGHINSMAVTTDGKYIISGGQNGKLKFWDIKTAKELKFSKGYIEAIKSVSIAPNGKYGFSVSRYGILNVWDTNKGKMIKTILGNKFDAHIRSIAISSDAKYALVRHMFETSELWNLKTTYKKVQTFKGKGHNGEITSLAITPNGKYALSGSLDKTLKLWDIKTGKEIRTFRGHTSFVNSVAITPNGKYALSGSHDETLKLWDIKTGKNINTFRGHRGYIDSVAIAPNGKYVLSGSSDKSLKLWDIKTGKNIKSFKGHKGYVLSVVITPNGKYILSGGMDNTLKLWDIKTGKNINTFKGHVDFVGSVSITKDGKYALSGSWDGTLKLWDIKTGKELLTMVSFSDGEWVSITPEGYFNASKNGAKYLNILTGPMEVTSIDSFYKKFYRPDLVKLAIQGVKIKEDESMAYIIKNKPAPRLKLLENSDSYIKTDKESYSLKIGIKDSGGGIGRIRVYINDSLVNTSDRALLLKRKGYDKIYNFNIALSEGENKIEVLAWNKDESMQSNPLNLTINSDIKLSAPNLYAIIVGIDKFENEELNLNYAVRDAKYLNRTIKDRSKALFKKIYIKSLTTKQQTTKENITKVFESFSKKMKPNDYFLFYIASHGEVENEKFYLITSNVLFLDEIKHSAISDNNLINLIGNIPTRNKIVFLDTCYAGDIGAKMASALAKKNIVSSRGLSAKDAIDLLKMESGASIFSASSNIQQALEGYNGHGLYTYFLVDGLKGKADNDKDGFVNLSELNRYIKKNVYKISKQKFNRVQIPYSNLGIDVPISKVK